LVEATATVTPEATKAIEIMSYEEIAKNAQEFLGKEGIYTDKSLETILFIPQGNGATKGKLGMLWLGTSEDKSTAGDQEVLLGGFMDKVFAYFVMGAMDKQQQRFVYIATVKTSLMPRVPFAVGKIDSPVFDQSYFSPYFVADDPGRLNQFIKDQTGKAIVVSLPTGAFTSAGIVDVNDDIKDMISTVNASLNRSRGIVNRVNRLQIFSGDVPGPIGNNDGIYYDKNQLTVEKLKAISFDPNKNPVFWFCDVKAPSN